MTVFDESSRNYSLKLAAQLRQQGIKTAFYPEDAKLQKQLKYADKIGARLALIAGPDEVTANKVTIKDLGSGNQIQVGASEAVEMVVEILARKQGS